jgi:carboxymethylenebutenolidase
MCVGENCVNEGTGTNALERRSFLRETATAIIGVALTNSTVAEQASPPPSSALNDPELVQEIVSFKSGKATIQGYQARPKGEGKYRGVVVMHGDFGLPEVNHYTAAVQAQNGFVSLAIKRFSRYPDLTLQDVIKSDRTDRRYLSRKFNEEELEDAQAAINYLNGLSIVKREGVGIVGFCGGGVQALWLSTTSKDIKVVVTLYASPGNSERYQNPKDPKPTLMEMVKRIRVPIQAHYGSADTSTPVDDVKKFEGALKAQRTPIETFYYEGARHAFCNYERPNYNAEACKLAMRRTMDFLKGHLQ